MASILADPYYIGQIIWNGKTYPGKHESLILPGLFAKVQQTLKGKATPKYSKHIYLFKGLIRHIDCGGVLTWERQKGTVYGHCNHYRNCPKQDWLKETELEQHIIENLTPLEIKNARLAQWLSKALKESHKDMIELHASALDELKQNFDRIQKRLNNLYEDKLDEKIDKDFYETKFQQYSAEKTSIFQAMQNHSQANDKYMELGANIFELSQKAKSIYLKATLEQKRQLLKLVFGNFTIEGEKLIIKYTDPFQVLAEAVKATNSSKMENSMQMPIKIFELEKTPINKERTPALSAVRPMWLNTVQDVRTILQRQNGYIYIPKLIRA